MPNLDSILKSRHYFANKGLSDQGYGFSSGHVWMTQSWTVKKAKHRRIDAFELWCWRRLLRVPWTARKSNQTILKSWLFTGRTDAETETPILWSHDAKNGLLRKDPDAGKDWRQEEKGTTENEMVEWHHWFNGQEFKQPLGDGDGQGSLLYCSPWGCKESDMTEQWNWTETPWPSGIYPWNVKLIFYLMINQCNLFIKEQKSYDHLNKYRKDIW